MNKQKILEAMEKLIAVKHTEDISREAENAINFACNILGELAYENK